MANCEQHCDFVRSNVTRMLWIAASHEMRDAQQHIVRAETVGPTVRPLSGGGSVKQLPAAGAAEPAYIIAYTHARTHTEREKEREGGGEHTIAHVNVTWRAHFTTRALTPDRRLLPLFISNQKSAPHAAKRSQAVCQTRCHRDIGAVCCNEHTAAASQNCRHRLLVTTRLWRNHPTSAAQKSSQRALGSVARR
jgi:hypothetical protein